MLQTVEHRKYIQDFLDFAGSFLITKSATIGEINLVKANLDILAERIANVEANTKIDGIRNGE